MSEDEEIEIYKHFGSTEEKQVELQKAIKHAYIDADDDDVSATKALFADLSSEVQMKILLFADEMVERTLDALDEIDDEDMDEESE
ncbi:hypothetical protein H6504_04755 [Candidatus Woesearchaeota archaeon]|nr:hypothetical protein [Candidatus Woesearchaeota archaeon]